MTISDRGRACPDRAGKRRRLEPRWLVLVCFVMVAACQTSDRSPAPTVRSPAPRQVPPARQASPSSIASVDTQLVSARPQPNLRGRLAFDNFEDIFVLNLPTGGIVRLTASPAQRMDPVWSPDGRRIGYRSDEDGSDDIWLMNADGTDHVNITKSLDRVEWGPTWSPDGRWLAFNQSTTGQPPLLQIRIVRPDGSDGRSLRTDYAEYPAWSPDGTRIAFASKRPTARGLNPDYDIHVVNVDGTGEMNLTRTPGTYEMAPHWSPDGSSIAFEASPVGTSATSIWRMNPDGGGRRQLAEPWTAWPAWSPDGEHVAFVENDGDIGEIKIMTADRTRVITLGLAAAGLGFVSWAP